MPRRHSRRRDSSLPPVGRGSVDRVETRGGRRWNVRPLLGSTKIYKCPGCLRDIAPGTGHVLVWPVEKALLSAEAIDERRHWHTECWKRLGG